MRYCKFLLADETAAFAAVTERGNEIFATELIADPLAPKAALPAVQSFAPVSLAQLEREHRLLVPVTPSKIVCVGRNYRDHAAELGNDVPTEPLLFLKPPSSLLPAGGSVVRPAISKRVDFEGELAIILGKQVRKLADDADVAPYIHGYTCLNDVTARDIQKSDPQWTRGKGFDTFCPTGPVVSDEINPLSENISLITRLNGEVKQRGETRDFIFNIPQLIRYISQCMTLEPGDVIATGTPAGVGPMQGGDVVEVEIAGLGTLRNTIA
jgi:2-keto-4-pentenoate hydratase/2-oxohepta-3-ene-1,7-dioic acid hydratase in catechol pathway